MGGNDEYKLSINSVMNETLTHDDDIYSEHYSGSGRVFAAVTPILHKYPPTVSFGSDCLDATSGELHYPQFYPLKKRK